MIRKILNTMGYISKAEAENIAIQKVQSYLDALKGIKPGDELGDAARVMRKYGFKIVYALNDGAEEENIVKLGSAITLNDVPIRPDVMVDRVLPNIKLIDDISLLK